MHLRSTLPCPASGSGLIAGFLLAASAAVVGADPVLEPHLPAYALGQPLEDARRVVPNGQTRETWILRCTGDPGAPAQLALSAPELAAGRMLCWPMRLTPGGAVRTPSPPRLHDGIEELELRHGRIVRIFRTWRTANGGRGEETLEERSR